MFPLHPRLSFIRTELMDVCVCVFSFFLCAVVFLRPTDPILESRENHHHLLRRVRHIGTTTSSFSLLCISSFAGWCDFYDDYFACASLTFNLFFLLLLFCSFESFFLLPHFQALPSLDFVLHCFSLEFIFYMQTIHGFAVSETTIKDTGKSVVVVGCLR